MAEIGTEQLFFYVFAFLALFSSIAMVAFVRHPVAGALSLVVTMISLAGIYVLLSAELVAVIQILVYAGAILVLFLFVIMLLDLRTDQFGRPPPGRTIAKLVGSAGAVVVVVALGSRLPAVLAGVAPAPELPPGFGEHRDLGLSLYGVFVVPVEIAGVLLLGAIVGAVVLARRRPG